MDFGEKFRAEHPSLSNLMSKSELDAYAEKLKSKINTTSFDKYHDTIFVKNSTLTKEQIDYLQLKLDIYIYRLNQEEIALNPFETCNIEANETKADFFMEQVLPFIVAIIITFLELIYLPSSFYTCLLTLSWPACGFVGVAFVLCISFIALLIMFGLHNLMYDVISNYEDNKYITRLKESSKI